jgi:hypothetical protein
MKRSILVVIVFALLGFGGVREVFGDGDTAAQDYNAKLTPVLDLLASALDGLGKQSTAAANSPALLHDRQWILLTAVHLVSIRTVETELQKIVPPPRFRPSHKELLKAAKHYTRATFLYQKGIDSASSTMIQAAQAELSKGTETMDRAKSLLSKP